MSGPVLATLHGGPHDGYVELIVAAPPVVCVATCARCQVRHLFGVDADAQTRDRPLYALDDQEEVRPGGRLAGPVDLAGAAKYVFIDLDTIADQLTREEVMPVAGA